jgi:EAL domain-containing protein (putative c-di-GMP-specific phosphodiesterase class I)
MRRAIDQGELVLHYQPKVRLADGSVESIEALVRWQHPEHGLLAPDSFVPLVEQTDLIDDLTAWVLDRALRDLVGLGPAYEHVAVAVNVSARSVVSQDLVTLVSRALERHAVSPSRLVIEITETALLVDPVRAASVLFDISDLGVAVSLDDFGVGQTSLSYLAALPIHEIKIDRSFVTDLSANTTHAAIARSITDLGRNLGVRVVAEGIEIQDVADALRSLGCELGQGWLYARALPIGDLQDWLVRTRDPAGLPVG